MVKNVNLGYTIIQTFGNYELSRLFPLFWAKDGNLMALTLSEEDRRVLQRLEEDLWREETRFDISYMDQVMAEDFFEFGRSGRVYNSPSMPSFPYQIMMSVCWPRMSPWQPTTARLPMTASWKKAGAVPSGHALQTAG